MKFEHHCVIDKITTRDEYIGQSTGTSVEGGALNANYRTVEAVAKVSALLGMAGYRYDSDFVWSEQSYNDNMDETVVFKFNDPKIKTLLGIAE
jgi:hypothetical protein